MRAKGPPRLGAAAAAASAAYDRYILGVVPAAEDAAAAVLRAMGVARVRRIAARGRRAALVVESLLATPRTTYPGRCCLMSRVRLVKKHWRRSHLLPITLRAYR